MGKSRGSIAFFGTYRPPVPLDIFSCPADPPPLSANDELLLTDGESYNQNGHPIPAAALKELLTFLGKKKPKLASECGATPEDAEKGRVAGLVFVSERDKGLETLHVALRFVAGGKPVKVLSLGDIYGADNFGGVRMEDSGRIAGGFKIGRSTVGYSLVYVSTKEPVKARRTPWTVVYKTNLADGKTERLTPLGQYDLSPAVSPSGKMVAVANFQQSRWNGEIENLKTDIVVMNVDRRAQGGLGRRVLIKDGGWPTWGSDNVIFFHRGFDTSPPTNTARWGVFRYDIAAGKETRVTPERLNIDAMTPAAISDTMVAVATVREKSKQVEMKVDRKVTQYRHIEIFDTASPGQPPVQITQKTRPEGDHYNPFVLDGGRRVGYHRCRTDKLHKVQQGHGLRGISIVATIYVAMCGLLGLCYWMLAMWRWFRKSVGATSDFDKTCTGDGARQPAPPAGCLGRRALGDVGPQNRTGASSQTSTISIQRRFDKVQPPESHADVGLFRVTGVFPSVSKNGKKLAFVDNEFKAVWLADSRGGLRVVYKVRASKSVFSTAWNQNDDLDTLYVCEGPAFSIDQPVQIMRIPNVSRPDYENIETFPLTDEQYNSAFPSTNADGTKLVFRSSRNRVAGGERKHKNLYIIDAEKGEAAGVDKLTDGPWTDTHCSWSPREGCDWVVFSSSGRPETDVFKGKDEPALDHGLDPGYFAVYLVNAGDVKKGGKVPVPVRVIHSAPTIAGHINHPVFSPDMASIVFTADLAAVSADPISMPHFTHSVRPYGDIFSVDLRDTTDMARNKDIQEFHRITHSRYEYSTPTWTGIADGDEEDPNAKWKMLESLPNFTPWCPYAKGKAGEKEGWHMTGHLTIKKRCC